MQPHFSRVPSPISQQNRALRNGHRGAVIWLTGLSASGKSSIARGLERLLFDRQMQTYVLDGDNIRHNLNANLGFSQEDRMENIRRVAEMAALMADAGLITICAFISPYRTDRARARHIIQASGSEFIEIYVNASLEVCESRDPKNFYKKARVGEIKHFTGIDAPYEAPENSDLEVFTVEETLEESVSRVLEFILPRLERQTPTGLETPL